MPNSQTIQWKRISAEGAAIVVSILLAFSIQAWWDDRQDRDEEQRIFLGLKAEFESNLELIEIELAYRAAVIDSILTMFDVSVGKTILELGDLDRLLGNVTWWTNVNYSRGVIDGVVQSGRLAIIENDELRSAIASMPNRYNVISISERNDQITTNDVVIPYLNTHSSLTQIANTMSAGRPGTGEVPTPPVYPVSHLRDHESLLSDPEFLGILVQEHWNHLETISAYRSLKATIEGIVRLIDLELASQEE